MTFSIWKCLFLLVVLLSFITSIAAKPKVVKMELNKKAQSMHANIEQRDTSGQSSNIVLENDLIEGLYLVNASVGTPPQVIQLQVDTGSSDVWMFGINSCDLETSPCSGSFFDPSKSSSFSLVSKSGFSITYDTPNSGVTGDYFNDTFSIGGITLHNLTMAVADETQNVPTGIMGIGFDTDESIVGEGGQPYQNFIDAMVDQGIIQTRAYSVWLNDLAAPNGAILFGGYDKAKFKGNLTALPIQPDSQSGQISTTTVAWTSLSVTDPQEGATVLTSSNFVEPAILDTGTSLTFLPVDLYYQIAGFFDVIEESDYAGGLVICEDFDGYTGTIDYGFGGSGGPVISVSVSELVIPITNSRGEPLQFPDRKAACQFGLAPLTDDDQPILFGDTFLRAAYLVYDLDNKQIAIAPTVANTTESNIVEIGQGSAAPSWSVASGATVTQTATGLNPGVLQPTGQITAVDTSATGFRLPSDSSSATTTATAAVTAAKSSAASPSAILPGTIMSILFSILSLVLGAAFIAFR